jgi:hypothetical protein
MATTHAPTPELSTLPALNDTPHAFADDKVDEKAPFPDDLKHAVSIDSDEVPSNYLSNGKERPIETANDIATR